MTKGPLLILINWHFLVSKGMREAVSYLKIEYSCWRETHRVSDFFLTSETFVGIWGIVDYKTVW